MEISFTEKELKNVMAALSVGNKDFFARYPGESEARQPVHTVYGGAQIFKHNTAQKMGEFALKNLLTFAPDANSFGQALGINDQNDLSSKVYARVIDKLKTEAVEDFRIDFEDGFGHRPDKEEDHFAYQAAGETAKGMAENSLPPFIGIRIKTLSEELKGRSLRTLDIYITNLLKETAGKLPNNFVVNLPKIVDASQVTALVDVFEILENKNNLPEGSLKMEFMIESPQSIFDRRGHNAMPSFIKAAKNRCQGAHFGTYDYTATLGITANYQTMDHRACDFARSMMKVAFAGTGIWLSDGATNVMPVTPHKGDKLSEAQIQENKDSVHGAWALSYRHIRHSLTQAMYQGWDLHPAQLPVRYGALYSFFLEGLDSASKRLKNFIDTAAKATLMGDIFDDAATGQGLLNYFLKALNCGAIAESEIEKTGLSLEEVRMRSFLKILQGRQQGVNK